MEWTAQNNDLIFYSVNVTPQAAFTYSVNGLIRRLQAELLYNTLYNVSITASHCGQSSSYSIELYYGELIQAHTGLIHTGSMCMGNGEWEPDPSKVKCTGKKLQFPMI